jgi:PAS domain S-box-containing protein
MSSTPSSRRPVHPPQTASFGSAGLAEASTRWMLETLLANLDGMVYRCRDAADWTMEFVSEGCMRLTGYSPEDLLLNGRLSYEELTHPDDRRRVREAINLAVAENRRFQIEYRIQHADGSVRWVWERGLGVRDEARAVVAIK